MAVAAWKKNLPLWATIFRILAVPVIMFYIIAQPPFWNWIAAGFFIIASISDWLDGYWARKYKVESDLGRLLDPIADKILVSTILLLLLKPLDRIEVVLVVLLLNRDILINGLRSFAAAEGRVIAAGDMGKWKTAVQMVAIPALLIHENIGPLSAYAIGYYGLWASLGLSLFSAGQYLWAYLKQRPA